jgi:hypothetical protein
MLAVGENERIHVGHARGRAMVFLLCVLALAAPSRAAADAGFRSFSEASLWNQTAAPIASSNPWASEFADTPNFAMKVSGTPENVTYGAPAFYAEAGDPTAPVVVTRPDWLPRGETRWDGMPVPVPSGVTPAPGSDGHLTVVSADRGTAWDFWGCTEAGPLGYVTRVIVQWDLGGPGHSTIDGDSSARGSGLPLLPSTLHAGEALNGVHHALGITVPRVSDDYVFPATHSDGYGAVDAIKYGMRFVLRADYPTPPNATVGVRNVIRGLKTYGAYIVDQGADFQIDADFTHPELWASAGVDTYSFAFTAADLRPAEPGPPASTPPHSELASKPATPTVVLRANRLPIGVGSRLRLRGKVRQPRPFLRARLEVRAGPSWRRLTTKPVDARGRFFAWQRLRKLPTRLHLRDIELNRGARVVKARAVVPGLGRSAVVRVPILP